MYNQTTIQDSIEETSDNEGLSSGVIIGIIGGLVVLILILFLFIRTSSNSPTAVVGLDNKREISVVEEELDIDLSPSGLLSRIQQNNKD
jgi:high-affinity Fe2+/Pb2+ permease